jgi:uncharacterized membrane protein
MSSKKLQILIIVFAGIFVSLFFCFQPVYARLDNEITDWYIQNFESDIVLNKDSSLLITEYITADCGNLPNKHGIFRILPLQIKTDKEIFKTPVELISITDFDGNPYKYQTTKSSDTVTWKIGDANKLVSGVNYYKIVYKVKNAVRFINSDFDELYWNLLGTFWQIDIDNFSANLFFSAEITKNNTQIDYYTGTFGSKDKSLARYNWSRQNSIFFESTQPIKAGEGITVSATFPKGIFTPYEPSFQEKYGNYFLYLFFLIPIAVFIIAFRLWQKYGDDPKMKKPIPPEFGIPDKITPMQMGMVISSGHWNDKLVTATIINLAVRKFISIEQTEEKVLFFTSKEIRLTKNKGGNTQTPLTETEKMLMDAFFSGKDTLKLSELKTFQNRIAFRKAVSEIKKTAVNDLVNNNWIVKTGLSLQAVFFTIGIIAVIWLSFWFVLVPQLFASILLSGIILIIFAVIMPKRTQAGADLLFKIKGFELYMKQAENYRQQFYEKENIFDKFLPYAIVFGIAELWAKKMQQIYGEDFYKNYHPYWFIGTGTFDSFSADSLTSQINSITTAISSTVASSSGSGGAGGAGGGGGGGGGGGW